MNSANVNDIEVLEHTTSTAYFGRELCLTDQHEVELKHRLRTTWAKFGTFKNELTDKTVPLNLRLKLFNSVLIPTMLYGCSSWTLTGTREAKLRSTQMKMLRATLGKKRIMDHSTGDIETWVEWVKRATGDARQAMNDHHSPDWVGEQRERLQRWGNRVGRMDDARWAKRVLEWMPEGRRSRGRPCARWADRYADLPLSLHGT